MIKKCLTLLLVYVQMKTNKKGSVWMIDEEFLKIVGQNMVCYCKLTGSLQKELVRRVKLKLMILFWKNFSLKDNTFFYPLSKLEGANA